MQKKELKLRVNRYNPIQQFLIFEKNYMKNLFSIFFIFSHIFTNITTASSGQKLSNIFEITQSYEEAKQYLDAFLPATFTLEKHKRNYNLLKQLDQQTQEILSLKNSNEIQNPQLKKLLINYMFTNTIASNFCETEYAIMPNLLDENNPEIDGNDFNIINTYKAYKKCMKIILMHTKTIEQISLN